jgi:hypothetical protein
MRNRAITLGDVLGEPDNARQKFDAWDKVIIRHAVTDDRRQQAPVGARATKQWVASGSYRFEVTGAPNPQCQHYLRGVDFLFGSIVRPPEGPSPQKTEYLACAGFNIVARYTSLSTGDWTEETLPALHESITRLFDRMLVNLRIMARYRTPPPRAEGPRNSYRLVPPDERPKEKVPCDVALNTEPLPLGRRAVAETPGFGEVFGKIIEASDCKREQILDYVRRIGARRYHDTFRAPGMINDKFTLNTYEQSWYLLWSSTRFISLTFNEQGDLTTSHWGYVK